MNNDPQRTGKLSTWKSIALPCLCAAALTFARAQQAPAPQPAPQEEPNDEIVEMAPFVVDSTKDSRYQAASTLSGSRLNTDLRDVAAIIDVFTMDIIDDFGVTDLDDLQNFATNVEADSSSIGTYGNASDTGRNFRIRGLPASRARNYFAYNYIVDKYNLERIDESRGPNAILYGFGSPGGIVNVAVKKAQTKKSRASLEMLVANTTSKRIALDINQVLVKDRLAFRINALTQEKNGWQVYTKDDRNAVHGAVTFTPWKKTAIYLEYEHFDNKASAARGNTFWSRKESWDAAGKPLVHTNYNGATNASAAANNPLLNGRADTLATLGTTNMWTYTEETGAIANWRGMSRSNTASYTAADGTQFTRWADFRNTALDVDGILKVNLMGPSNFRNTKYDLGFVTWQQEILKNLNLETAATWQYAKWNAVRYGNVTLYADPNYYLPAGGSTSNGPAAANPVKNPYAGEYYVDGGAPQFWFSNGRTKNARATLSYSVNLGRNLGYHRIALLAERDEFELLTRTYLELARIDGTIPTGVQNNPENEGGNIYRRHYVLNPSNARDYRLPNVFSIPQPLDMITADGKHLTTELAQRYGADNPDYKKTITTAMLVLQSAWLSGRLNTILGMRNDRATYYDWSTYRNNGNGSYERNPDNYVVTAYPGRTYTYAAVAHLTDWLSLFFNASTSMGDPKFKVSYAPDGHVMETMQGLGHDYGVKFSIPGTRLQGMVTYYKARSTNEPSTGGTGNESVDWLIRANNRILSALVDQNVMTQSEVAGLQARGSGDTTDAKTHGLEAAIAGDITKNWSLRATYAYTKRVRENSWPRITAWRDNVLLPFWATLERENPNLPGTGTSIMDSVTTSDGSLRQTAGLMLANMGTNTENSLQVRGTRPHKLRLFSTYFFDHGPLKGIRFGGGVRYDSPNIAGQDADGRNQYGFSNTNFDFMLQYNTQLLGVNWRFQVNLYNAFQSKPKASPSLINPAGTWDSILVYPPREISLTAQVKF